MIASLLHRVVFLALLAVTLTAHCSIALSDEIDRVLVIENGNSPVSKAVAKDYAKRRGANNILIVRCQDSAVDSAAESLDFKTYQSVIELPVRSYLLSHPEIDFIVLTKGIPIRLTGVPTGKPIDRLSLDGHLAALDYDRLPGARHVEISRHFGMRGDPKGYDFDGIGWANRFWNSAERFSHARFGGYLVTRLDGYTAADAEALTTRSLEASQAARTGKKPAGDILLNVNAEKGYRDELPGKLLGISNDGFDVEINGHEVTFPPGGYYGIYNSDMRRAAKELAARDIAVELIADRFVGNRVGLAGYISWGSNDPRFDAGAYHSLSFVSGAVAETAVSTSGRTFLPTQDGQSLIADLIAQGITGVKGYTDEPFLEAMAVPTILFDRYTRGWTLAESFYAASALVGWEDIVIGDPLARAYPPQSVDK